MIKRGPNQLGEVGDGMQLVPQNLPLEVATFACILVENDLIDVAKTRLEVEDYYSHTNQTIYKSMMSLRERGLAIDHVTLREDLQNRQQLAQVGGDEYLFSLTNLLPHTAHFESYLKQLSELGQRRRFIYACGAVASAMRTPDMADPIAWAMSEINQAAKTKDHGAWGGDGLEIVRGAVSVFHAGVEYRQQTGSAIAGISTGLARVDDITGGMMPGEVVVVAGRPGMGKTAFALNVASASIYGERPRFVPFFSLEMPKEQLGARLICQEGHISASRWRRCELRAEEMAALVRTTRMWSEMNDGHGPSIYVHDKPAINVTELRVVLRRERKKWEAIGIPLGPVFVDYLQLMQADDRSLHREQAIADISRNLKTIAKEENVPVIALSQLNRSVETRSAKDKRPQLSDLRESGAIEQDADTVWFLYRDEVYNPDSSDRGVAEVIVGKHRSARLGTARVAFLSDWGLFRDLAGDDARGAPRDGVYDVDDDMAGF